MPYVPERFHSIPLFVAPFQNCYVIGNTLFQGIVRRVTKFFFGLGNIRLRFYLEERIWIINILRFQIRAKFFIKARNNGIIITRDTRSGIVLGAGIIDVKTGAKLTSNHKISFETLVNAENTQVQFADDMNVSLTMVQDAPTGDIILRAEAVSE